MIDYIPIDSDVSESMRRDRALAASIPLNGFVDYELDKGGKLYLPKTRCRNGVVNVSKNSLLGLWFNGTSSPGSNWYIGLVDGPSFTAFQASDVMGGTLSWSEFTNYTVSGNGSNRGTWGKGSAAGQAVTNSSPLAFDFTGISGSTTVHGIFVVNVITKGGTTGTLWSTAAFNSPITVETGDQLRVTYTVQL